MRMLRALLTMTLVLGGAVSMTAAHADPESDKVTSTFSDVPVSHTFWAEIEFLAATGITTGYTDGGVVTFRPGQPVLREQMAAFLYRLETLYNDGVAPEFELPSSSPFGDVSPTDTFYKEIVWLAGTGISTGYADGTFRPGQPVLREQMAAFLCRFDTATDCSDLSEIAPIDPFQVFDDVPPGHTFFDAIFFMAGTGISTGYLDSLGRFTYRPAEPVLREQMAAFLTRYIALWTVSESIPVPPSQAVPGPDAEELVQR